MIETYVGIGYVDLYLRQA